MAAISVGPSHPVYKSMGGVLFSKDECRDLITIVPLIEDEAEYVQRRAGLAWLEMERDWEGMGIPSLGVPAAVVRS